MKDLRLFKEDYEIGWLRVDSISGEGNLTVMETYGLNDRNPNFDPEHEDFQIRVDLATNFMKIPKTFADIIEFATDNDLTLIVQDQKSSEIVLGGPVITTASPLTAGVQNAAYAGATIETSGDSGHVSFSVSEGTLPTGLTLNADTGAISGTPTVAGTSVFTISAFDHFYASSVVKEFTIVVAAA